MEFGEIGQLLGDSHLRIEAALLGQVADLPASLDGGLRRSGQQEAEREDGGGRDRPSHRPDRRPRARRRRLAALALLAVWLIVGGIFARSSGDPWASLAAPVALGGFSVLLLALVVSLRSSDQDAAKPLTWQ